MKKYFFIIIATAAVMAAGCSEKVSDRSDGLMGGWRIVRSPISGSCYEAYDYGPGNQRVFSLGKEVKCSPPDQLK